MSSNQTEKFNLEKNQINAKNESLENKMALTGSTSSNEMIPEVESQEMDEFFDARNFISKSRNIICPNCSEKVDTVVKFKRANCGRKCRLGCLAGSFLCCFGYVQIYIYIHFLKKSICILFYVWYFRICIPCTCPCVCPSGTVMCMPCCWEMDEIFHKCPKCHHKMNGLDLLENRLKTIREEFEKLDDWKCSHL